MVSGSLVHAATLQPSLPYPIGRAPNWGTAPAMVASTPFPASALQTGSLQTAMVQPALFNEPVDASLLQEPYEHSLKKQHKRFALPWDWLSIAALTAAGVRLPTLVMPITYAVDTNFAASFNGQDLVGMGAPRIYQSLLRDAIPYDWSKDPKAQQLEGLNKTLYIYQQRAKRANWQNLYEEIQRELASGPGLLMGGTIGVGAMKGLARFTGFPEGRRAMELPQATIDTFLESFQQHIQQAGLQQGRLPKDPKAFFKTFFKERWANEVNPEGKNLLEEPVDFTLRLQERSSHPDYALTKHDLKRLLNHKEPALEPLREAFEQKQAAGHPKPTRGRVGGHNGRPCRAGFKRRKTQPV
jgi:hypothetical protein